MSETNKKNAVDFSIFAIGHSNRHLYRAAKMLVKELINIDYEYKNPPYLSGRKDDEWMIVSVGS